jgi:hypothetical protein
MAGWPGHGKRGVDHLKHCRGCTKTLRQQGRVIVLRHGARLHRCRRGDPAADAAAALRLSGRMAAAAQSGAGAGTAAGAGAARGPAPNAGPATPASPAAPGITAASFSDWSPPATFAGAGVEPFEFRPDIFLPGTLHHSGNKPAPPSDHIPLARRSAFGLARRRASGNGFCWNGPALMPDLLPDQGTFRNSGRPAGQTCRTGPRNVHY